MKNFILVSNLVEENGKTVRENNLEKTHEIPIGALVEITYEEDKNSQKGVRMFVVNHSRDCDGTPLYDLSYEPNAQIEAENHEQEMKKALGDEQRIGMLVTWKYNGLISRHWSKESIKEISR